MNNNEYIKSKEREVARLIAEQAAQVDPIQARRAEAERQLAIARAPKRIEITGPRGDLVAHRNQLQQKLDARNANRREQEELALRAQPKNWREKYRATILNNAKLGDVFYRREDELELKRLEHINAQLAELDRRGNTVPDLTTRVHAELARIGTNPSDNGPEAA